MIARLAAENFIFQAQLADEAKKYELSDHYLQQAAGFIRLSSQKKKVFSQEDSKYLFLQKDQQEKVVSATQAWIEYIGDLMSRVLTNNGPDANAIAAYAVDIHKKIDELGKMAFEEAKEGRAMQNERNLSRRGPGLSAPGGMSSIGWGASQGLKGMGQGFLQNIKNIPDAARAWKEHLAKGTAEGMQETTGGIKALTQGGPFPTPDRRAIPTGPNWQNPALEGNQSLLLNGYYQGLPYGITWEQASGTGKGELAPGRPSEIYKDHPAMRDPSENSAGFKAMEAVWTTYVDKFLPLWGITLGNKKGIQYDKAKFPQVFEKTSAVETPIQNSNNQIPPPPDLNVPQKIEDPNEAAKLEQEKEFFIHVFQQVEANLRGEGGATGATLKGVVKDAAFAMMTGDLIDMTSTLPLAGQAVGGAAGNLSGLVATRPSVANNPILGPATRGMRPNI